MTIVRPRISEKMAEISSRTCKEVTKLTYCVSYAQYNYDIVKLKYYNHLSQRNKMIGTTI